jgi:hypothetical protein
LNTFSNILRFEDICWQHVVSSATILSPEIVQAARERGQQSDLFAMIKEPIKEISGYMMNAEAAQSVH